MERLHHLLSPSPDSAAAPSEEEADPSPCLARPAHAHYTTCAATHSPYTTCAISQVHQNNVDPSTPAQYCEVNFAQHTEVDHSRRLYGLGSPEVDRTEEIQLRLTSEVPLSMTKLSLYYSGRQSASDLTLLVDSPLNSGDVRVRDPADSSLAASVALRLAAVPEDLFSSSGGGHRRGRSPDSETNSASSLLSKNTTIHSAQLNDTLDSGFVTTKGSDKGENMNDTFDSDNTAAGGAYETLLLSDRTMCDRPPTASGATIFDCEQGCFISVEEYNRRYGHREKLWYEE